MSAPRRPLASWLTIVVTLLLTGAPIAVALRGLHLPAHLALATPVVLALAAGFSRLAVPGLPVALARRHPLAAGLWTLLLVAAVVQVARASLYANDVSQPRFSADPGSAFRVEHYCMTAYAEAARFAIEGRENIYDVRLYNRGVPERRRIGPLTVDPFHYPPPFLLVPATVRLVAPEFFDARRVWFGLQVLVLAGGLLAVARWAGGDAGQRVALGALVVWAAPHLFLALQTGNFQVTAIPMAMMGAMLAAGRHVPLGASLLVFAAAGKVFPSMLVLHIVATWRRRVIVSMAVAAVVLALVTLAWFGTAPFVQFVFDEFPRLVSGASFPQTEQPGSAHVNSSIYGLTTKLRVLGVTWMDAATGKRIAQAYAALLAAFAVFSGWRRGGCAGHADVPVDAPSRLRLAILWLSILNLASFASPFVGVAYGMVGTIWLVSLLAAIAATPRTRAAWLLLLVPMLAPSVVVAAPIANQAPDAATLVLSMAGQLLVLAVNVAGAWIGSGGPGAFASGPGFARAGRSSAS